MLRAVAQRAACDVVLLRRHPGLRAVRRDHGRRRDSSAGHGPGSRCPRVRCAAARWCAVSPATRWRSAPSSPPVAAVGATDGRAFAGQRRRDEARRIERGAVGRDRQVAHVRTDRDAAGLRIRRRVEAQHAAAGFQSATKARLATGDITMPNGCDPRGSASVRVTARVAGSITLIVAACLVAHPQQSGRRHRDGPRRRPDPHFAELRAASRRRSTVTLSLSMFTAQGLLPWPGREIRRPGSPRRARRRRRVAAATP